MSVPCVFITGSSGTGKSTLLQSCLRDMRPGIHVPLKKVTRELRSPEEALELQSVTPAQFEQSLGADEFQVHYENYGERYGIPRNEFSSIPKGAVYVQALPTYVALKLKESLSPLWDVRICLLKADEELIRRRLEKRGESKGSRYFSQRVQGARFDFSDEADFSIATNIAADSVYQLFSQWFQDCFETTHIGHGDRARVGTQLSDGPN